MELLDFEVVALALDGSLGGEDAHMAALGELSDDLGSRTDDAQHATLRIP